MEAVKQGSATVGLKSRTHAVLVALKVWVPVLGSDRAVVNPFSSSVGGGVLLIL